MTDSSPQTITLPLPAIEGMTIAFQGVNYLRPEKNARLRDHQSRAGAGGYAAGAALFHRRRAAPGGATQAAGLYQRSGGVPYLVVNHAGPARGLIINATSQRLKFLESLIASSASDNVHGMQILGLALTFTVEQAA